MSVHSPATIHDAVAGPADPSWPPIDALIVVNPNESDPTGWGSPNVQQFQSPRTNALHTTQSAEQGIGVGPERRWAHYPHVEQFNPFRRLNIRRRDGGDSYSDLVYRPEIVAYWAQALQRESGQAPVKQRQGPPAVVNQPPYTTLTAIVPPSTPGGW